MREMVRASAETAAREAVQRAVREAVVRQTPVLMQTQSPLLLPGCYATAVQRGQAYLEPAWGEYVRPLSSQPVYYERHPAYSQRPPLVLDGAGMLRHASRESGLLCRW